MAKFFQGFVTVVSKDACDEQKATADFVCLGENDELILQKAIDKCVEENKNLYLANGVYHIDGFYDFQDGGPLTALCFPNCKREICVYGQSLTYGKGEGVCLYVSAKALESINEETVDVIRTTWTPKGMGSGSSLRIENIAIDISHNQKPIRAIDLRRCDRPELKQIKMGAYFDMPAGFGRPPAIAAKGCIGLTMTDGSNHSSSNYTNVHATGFYEGIQVGGEHVVMINCSAIMCCYGYTFGNYQIRCGANHPITMINCMDERNVHLPLFNACGDDDGNGARLQGEQEVTMISFNIERIAKQTPGGKLGDLMREVYPGTWKGNIGFTAQPAWCHLNEKNFQIWENDGSGKGFITRNNCHKLICGTEERESYYPTYGQQIFDTDLNKMLICIDPAAKKWVDFNGNEV